MATRLERQSLELVTERQPAEGEAVWDSTISSTRVSLDYELENARLIEPETAEEEEEAETAPVAPGGEQQTRVELELNIGESGGGGGGGGGGGSDPAAKGPSQPQPAEPGATIKWWWVAGASGALIVAAGVGAWFFGGRKGEGKRQPNRKRKRRN